MPGEFELVRLRGGGLGIRSKAYDEICHPGIGPRAEAEALYVRGLNLPARFAAHAALPDAGEFVIWDVGLGGAANAVAAIDAAVSAPVRLRVLSFDRSLGQLEFAIRHAGELGYFGNLGDNAARLITASAIEFTHGKATIRWVRELGDFTTLLAQSGSDPFPAPHAILFDPHSPGANPEMWTLPLFRLLFAQLDARRACALATYSRSTAVRSALLLAGFHVGIGGVTATKEDTTLAANDPRLLPELLGARWLERARRSRAAEPWVDPPFGGRPLSAATWEALRAMPQFQSKS